MDGFGQSESTNNRQPWTLQMMIENKERWNLAADVGVLDYLQNFGNNLFNETENTLQLLDSFEAELNTSCVEVSNITNKFLALTNSQFVENRVYDDEEASVSVNNVSVVNEPVKTKAEKDKEVDDRIKEAISNGLNVLKTKFEVVEVVNSDSDDDDSGPSGVVYRPINPFNNQPLPHLIGSVEFMKDPTVGLEEPSSDDDQESVSESFSSESKGLSEENDESEIDSDHTTALPVTSGTQDDNLPDSLYKQPISSSFADHLTKRLEDMDNERKIKSSPQKPVRNVFSTTPPPLDDICDDDFGSSEDLIFGNRSNRKLFDEDAFGKSKSSLWDDDGIDDFSNTRNVSNGINERRKNAMSDFEKELSRNLEKRKVRDEDEFSDILSPSPPPLDKEVNFDDSRYGDDYYDGMSSKSLFTSNESKPLPATSSKGDTDQFYNQEVIDTRKHLTDNEVAAKSVSNLRRRNFGDDTDDDSVINNENLEDIDDAMFKTGNQHSKPSSRSSSVKMSESFQDDNVSVKSNRSVGLFDDIVTNVATKSTIKKNMDSLFSDLNYKNEDGSDDDDLFSSNLKSDSRMNSKPLDSVKASSAVITNTSASKSNVIDDLFGEFDNDDIFSKLSLSKVSEPKGNISETTKVVKNKNRIVYKEEGNSSSTPKNIPSSLFDDDEEADVFGSDSIFVKGNIHKANDSKFTASDSNVATTSKKKLVGGLFGDTDESDLFGNGSSLKDDLFSPDLFKSNNKATNYEKEIPPTKDNTNVNVVSNMFSDVESDALFNDLKTHSIVINNSSNDNTVVSDNENKYKKDSLSNMKKVIQTDSSSSGIDNRNIIKSANVKQISLLTDEENSRDTDELFAKKNVGSNESKKDIIGSSEVDNSPLFNEIGSKTVLFKESSEYQSGIDSKGCVDEILNDDSNKGSCEVLDDVRHSKRDVGSNVDKVEDVSSEQSVHDKDNLFDVDKSLPNVPTVPVKSGRPEVAVKPRPNKPEPPKSLNIRGPFSSPEPRSSSDSKVTSIIQSLDVPDGGAFSSEKSSEKSSSPRVPGKLNLEKTLRIDPKALLPGARPISFKKSSSPESKDSDFSGAEKSSNVINASLPIDKCSNVVSRETSVQNSEPVLHSIAKDRVKIQVKRRPQTRKARKEAVRQSMIENAGDDDDDETDNSSSMTTHSGKEKSTASSLFDPASNILSPSTDEEDLFGIPPLDLPADYTKVSMSPGDIFGATNTTVISPDLNLSGAKKEDSTSKNVGSGDKPNSRKTENSDDLFNFNEPNFGQTATVDLSSKHDLFSNEKHSTEIGEDIFDNGKSSVNNSDLFSVIMPTKIEEREDDIFILEKEDKYNIKEVTSTNKSIFSGGTSSDSGDLFKQSVENYSKSSDFVSKETEKSRDDGVNTSIKELQSKEKELKTESKQKTDIIDVFTDVDDSDLFAPNVSKASNTESVDKGELIKQTPPSNIICNVFNTGVVNICDKLSITPPNDDELFPPSDWSASGASKQKNMTITSVPEKIKTDSLFGDDLEDDLLFAKVQKKVSTQEVKSSEGVGDSKMKTDGLFSNDVDDGLFGEVKSKKTFSVEQSNTTNRFDDKQNQPSKVKSLFDGDFDDESDIFGSSASVMKSNSKRSSESIFASSSSSTAVQSMTKKSAVGVTKTASVTPSAKTSETNKASTKDKFIDPLSAFTDND